MRKYLASFHPANPEGAGQVSAPPARRERRRAGPIVALSVLAALSSACSHEADSAVPGPAPAGIDRGGAGAPASTEPAAGTATSPTDEIQTVTNRTPAETVVPSSVTRAPVADGGGATTSTPPDAGSSRPAGTLTIYFVDTEGGQATVFSLPNGQILMVDTGNAGMRDGERILSVVRDELGASTVDYLLITHYDGDHVGGVPYLASRARVVQYFDHGDLSFAGQPNPTQYLALANAAERRIVVPGDVLSLGDVDLNIVSAGGALIDRSLSGSDAPNPFCAGALTALPGDPMDENVNSVGFVLRFGAFDFLDLGDLLWFEEHGLACPTARLGQIDLYLTTHHGTLRSGAPQLVRAIEPLAAIMNNGPRKGGGSVTWDTLALAPGGADVWQLHRALAAPDAQNAPPDQIANLEEGQADQALYLKVTADSSGKFTILNPRTNSTKTYGPR